MRMKKFTADSFYEAYLLAQQELGEDVMIITSRTFDSPIWGGLASREMIEVTVAVPRARDEEALRRAPRRPAMTEEVSFAESGMPPRPRPSPATPGTPFPGTSLAKAISKPIPVVGKGSPGTSSGKPRPAHLVAEPAAPSPDPGVYNPFGKREFRNVHGLRTMQEGSREPRPQRFSEEQLAEQKVQSLLDALAEHRTREKPQVKREEEVSPSPAPSPAPPGPTDSSVRHLEEKLAILHGMLEKVLTSSDRIPATVRALPRGLSEIQDRFRQAETPEEVVSGVVDFMSRTIPPQQLASADKAKEHVRHWLDQAIRFSPEPVFDQQDGPRILILLGPTGVGKTTTIAKLAASFALNVASRKSVALFTLDTFRIGAPNQLSQYAQIIEADLEIIYSADEIPEAIERHAQKDLILVDTAGRCQKNRNELEELKRFVKRFPTAETYLTLSATTKYSDMMENIKRFGEIGFDHLIFTKVDETNSVGPLLGLLAQTTYPLAYITHGQSVPDDFQPAVPAFFTEQLFAETWN